VTMGRPQEGILYSTGLRGSLKNGPRFGVPGVWDSGNAERLDECPMNSEDYH